MTENQNKMGSLPKYADSATVHNPPTPSIKRLPTRASLTVPSGSPKVLQVSISLYVCQLSRRIPLRLDKICDSTCGGSIIREKGCDGDYEEKQMLFGVAPVERVVRIAAWLWYEDRASIC